MYLSVADWSVHPTHTLCLPALYLTLQQAEIVHHEGRNYFQAWLSETRWQIRSAIFFSPPAVEACWAGCNKDTAISVHDSAVSVHLYTVFLRRIFSVAHVVSSLSLKWPLWAVESAVTVWKNTNGLWGKSGILVPPGKMNMVETLTVLQKDSVRRHTM